MRTVLLGFLALLLCECTPGVGSSCVQSTDCSPTGQLLCDTSQPAGYCTILGCQPDRCPSGSACVDTNIAPLDCPYDDRHAPSRFSKQSCLATCQHDSDCRQDNGYACIDPATYGLLLLDLPTNDNYTTLPDGGLIVKVCLAATSYQVSNVDGSVAPVCSNSGPPVPAFDAGPGYQGDAGADAGDAGAVDAAADAPTGDAGADASDASTD